MVQIGKDLFDNNLDILQEVELELVESHDVGGDGMKLPLVVSLGGNDPILPHQISEGLRVVRLEQPAFVLHNESIEGWIRRGNRPLSEETT